MLYINYIPHTILFCLLYFFFFFHIFLFRTASEFFRTASELIKNTIIIINVCLGRQKITRVAKKIKTKNTLVKIYVFIILINAVDPHQLNPMMTQY